MNQTDIRNEYGHQNSEKGGRMKIIFFEVMNILSGIFIEFELKTSMAVSVKTEPQKNNKIKCNKTKFTIDNQLLNVFLK